MTYDIDFQKTFSELFKGKPEEAKIIKDQTKIIVKTVEKHHGVLAGVEKQKEAAKAMAKALMLLVDIEGPIDDMIKSMLEPHINNLIDWVVDELNKSGEMNESN